MKVNEISRDDLFWKIEYDSYRCTFCGKCVAACPFGSIEAKVEKRRRVVSEGLTPTPKLEFKTVPIIQQVVSTTEFCRGCGICERVCPNEAIKPVRNDDDRFDMKIRSNTGMSFTRGGR